MPGADVVPFVHRDEARPLAGLSGSSEDVADVRGEQEGEGVHGRVPLWTPLV